MQKLYHICITTAISNEIATLVEEKNTIFIYHEKSLWWRRRTPYLSVMKSPVPVPPIAQTHVKFQSCASITSTYKKSNARRDQTTRIYMYDDVIKWKHFPRYWPFVRAIHRFRWIPHTKASDAELDVFFDLSLNKRLTKQPCIYMYVYSRSRIWGAIVAIMTSM